MVFIYNKGIILVQTDIWIKMNKLNLLIIFMLLSTSLYGYSKKIIIESFSTKANAKRGLAIYKKKSNYKKLEKLAKENNFEILTRKSENYYIIVAEPIFKKEVGVKAYKLIKKDHKGAYPTTYVAPEDAVVKTQKLISKKAQPVIKKEKVKEIAPKKKQTVEKMPVKPVEMLKTKSIETKPKKVSNKVEESSDFNISDILKYLLLISILSAIIFFYLKLKRIYDKY